MALIPQVMRCFCTMSVLAALCMTGPSAAIAQDLGPLPNFLPPPPPPPPPPSMAIPQVPKFDQVQQPKVQRNARPSYGDRFNRCLDDAARAGLSPNERSAYARGCAN